MTQPATPDWEEIRLAWETTHEPVKEIGDRVGVFHLNIHRHAKRHGWSARPTVVAPPVIASPVIASPVEPAPTEPKPTGPKPGEPKPGEMLPIDVVAAEPAAPTPVVTPSSAKPRAAKSVLASRAGVQGVIDRITRAIVRRLDILEQQLATIEIMNTQDAERIDRSMRIVMQNFEKVRTLDAANKPRRAAKINTAGDAASIDTQRHALAERIERFNAQWLARRVAGGLASVGAEPAENTGAQQLADGSASGAVAAAP